MNVRHSIEELKKYREERLSFLASKNTNAHKNQQVAECIALLETLSLFESEEKPKLFKRSQRAFWLAKGDSYLNFITQLDKLIKKELSFEKLGDIRHANLLNLFLKIEDKAMDELLNMWAFEHLEKAYFVMDNRQWSQEVSNFGEKGASKRAVIDSTPNSFRAKLRYVAENNIDTTYGFRVALCYARISAQLAGQKRDIDKFDAFVGKIAKINSDAAAKIREEYNNIIDHLAKDSDEYKRKSA